MSALSTALADQAMATAAEVEQRCGANGHLTEDEWLHPLPLEAPQFRWGYTITAGHQWPGQALSDGPRVYERFDADCDRCQAPTNFAGGRTLELPAGASIIRVRCCADCVAEVDRNFSDVLWL